MSEFTDGLRAMADWLEVHGEEFEPRWPIFNVFISLEQATTLARSGNFEKGAGDNWFWLRKDFGGCINLDFNVPRDKVCELVTVGEEEVEEQVPVAFEMRKVKKPITEWRCGSLLGKEG